MKKSGFQFVNYSGTYQLRLETADDLKAIPMLDEPFWMATSAPLHQLQCDPKLLEFLDQDCDGRILSADVRRTLEWLQKRLVCLDGITAQSDVLRIDHIHDATPEGHQILVTARRILQNLKKSDVKSISLNEVRSNKNCCADGFYGGNGVIPLDNSIEDDKLKEFISDIAVTMGSVPDVNGNPGVDQNKLDAFLNSAGKLLAWKKSAKDNDGKLFPLGDATSDGYKLLSQLRGPVNKYFRLCRLSALNRMLDRSTPDAAVPVDILGDMDEIDEYMSSAPLARPNPDGILDLHGDLSPEFRERLQAMESKVISLILGSELEHGRLGEAEWVRINSEFSAYEDWLKSKSGSEVEKLGPEKLRAYLDNDFSDSIRKMIAMDMEIGKEMSAVQDLEYLILLQSLFLELCNNFINFNNLYDPHKRAMFEMGRLVISGRVFNMNILVKDPGVHSLIAKNSGIYLMYSEVTGSKPEEKFFIATPVTALTVRRLGVERRGVLFDRDEREWDTRIVKVIDNPVSLQQAIMKPFRRLGQVVSGSFEKIVGGTEKQLDSTLSKGMGRVESGLKEGISHPGAVGPKKSASPREWVLTGSIAIAALGSSFAFIAKTLSSLQWHSVAVTVLIVLAIVMVPIILIADYKLYKRNLSSLLEASGWAINAEMRLSRNLAKMLTPKTWHPAGFTHIRRDLTNGFLKTLNRGFRNDENNQDI